LRVGLVEDDEDQRALLEQWLGDAGHATRSVGTVAEAIAGFAASDIELFLIDWMLPDGTGADLLRWARADLGWAIPILVLTARDDEDTVVGALQAGADDYVVKPAKRAEFLARVAALGRRLRSGELPLLAMGAYEIDVSRQRLCVDGREVTLTQKEFDLATYLFQSPGKLLSRDHLLDRIWGIHADVDTRTVDTHISRLRKKLGLDGTKAGSCCRCTAWATASSAPAWPVDPGARRPRSLQREGAAQQTPAQAGMGAVDIGHRLRLGAQVVMVGPGGCMHQAHRQRRQRLLPHTRQRMPLAHRARAGPEPHPPAARHVAQGRHRGPGPVAHTLRVARQGQRGPVRRGGITAPLRAEHRHAAPRQHAAAAPAPGGHGAQGR
jgi:two-component system response regulator RegX3